jgi:hypothetical protein
LATHANICMICAWRKTCLKRFSIVQDEAFHCPDFTRDVTIKDMESEKEQSAEKERET